MFQFLKYTNIKRLLKTKTQFPFKLCTSYCERVMQNANEQKRKASRFVSPKALAVVKKLFSFFLVFVFFCLFCLAEFTLISGQLF